MRRLSPRHSVLVLAALAGTLLLAGPAPAAKKLSPFAAQIDELHKVKLVLELADRDYKGHRAEAVRHVTAAIHTLEMGHKHKHGKGVKGGGEPQLISDAQLKESAKALAVVQAQLAGCPVSTPARRPPPSARPSRSWTSP